MKKLKNSYSKLEKYHAREKEGNDSRRLKWENILAKENSKGVKMNKSFK